MAGADQTHHPPARREHLGVGIYFLRQRSPGLGTVFALTGRARTGERQTSSAFSPGAQHRVGPIAHAASTQ